MAQHEEIMGRLLAIFRTEAEEHVQVIGANLLTLEQGAGKDEETALLEATFREMHTLKGAARSVGAGEVERRCQSLETILSALVRGRQPLTPDLLASLRSGTDEVGKLLVEPAASGESPGLPDSVPVEHLQDGETGPGGPAPVQSIRLSSDRLDAVLLHAEDLLALRLAAAERLQDIRGLAAEAARCRERLVGWRPARAGMEGGSDGAGEDAGDLEEPLPMVRALEERIRQLQGVATLDHQAISGGVGDLLEELRELRLSPASTILGVFPRMVRDLAAERGKEVAWSVRGADQEVDRRILEAMKESLIHLVRNAIDHGIETPETRLRLGKPPRGSLRLSMERLEGGWIEVTLEDDGAGIDPARVRDAAGRARLGASAELEAMAVEDVLQLVYRSGLSTSPMITDLSGHGLGLSIAKERVERLGGQISLRTTPNQGTAFRLIFPATITTFRGLLVGAGGQRFLVPLESVVRAARVEEERLGRVEGRPVLQEGGAVVPVRALADLLGLPRCGGDGAADSEAGGRRWCLILRAGDQLGGLLVDAVEGDAEVLVKEFSPPLIRVRHVSGAGLLGSGQVVLILRVTDLVTSLRTQPLSVAAREESAPAAGPQTILVVDDSITTRSMEKSLLEAAGYRVHAAADGIGAWGILKSESVDLVLSDVDMPRLNGFDLTARIRADADVADLPVVLVTALESREDKERGIAVGANAYVLKSSFDQTALLEIIRRLI